MFEQNEPIIHKRRTGKAGDEFPSLSDVLTLDQNGKAILTEIPDEFSKVVCTGLNKTWSEIQSGLPNDSQFLVDYKNKIVTFHITHAGKQLSFSYKGTGLTYVPSSMIYTDLGTDGGVVETLKDVVDNTNESITNAETAAENANTQAQYALEQANYAKGIRDNFGHKGSYSLATAYKNGNVVAYGGTNYICVQDTTVGIDPLNGAYWTVVAPQATINTKTWTATANQSVFTIANGSYVTGKGNIDVTVGGVPQTSGIGFTETNSTTITLSEGVPVGTNVFAKWFEGAMTITKTHGSGHEKGGQDELDITKLKNYQEMIATPLAEKAQQNDLDSHTTSQVVPIPFTYKKIALMNSGTNTFRLVTFGDSYGQKLMGGIWTDVQKLFKGWQGSYFIGALNGITNNTTSGSVTDNTADFTRWVSGITTTFGVGGSRTYGLGGASAYCNKIKIYYVKEPGAGTFKVQMDGVDQTGYTSVSATNATTQLGIITLSPAAGNHNVTIVGLTGTVTIIGVGFENTSANGVVIINVAQGGILLNAPNATAWSNFTAFLADVQPDLMTFEMKEDSSYFSTALETFFTAVRNGWQYMDVIGIGSPPVSLNDADQVIQNAQLRAACMNHGAVYWDSYKIFGSYQTLVDIGWNADGTHVSADCDAFRGSLMLRDLGLAHLKGIPSYRDGDLANVVFRKMYNQNTAGTIQAEPSFGLDLQVKLNRELLIVDKNGTLLGQISATPANSWLPNKTRLGSSSNACLNGDDADTISVRKGASTGAFGNIRVNQAIADKLSVTNSTGATTLGSVVKKIEVFDSNGNSLGFVPVYNSIT